MTLFVSPQGNYVATDKQRNEIEARINVIWAKTKDLTFDGEPFLPKENDKIEYEDGGIVQRYSVTSVKELKVQSSFRQNGTFAYEDGLHRIIKIMTVREK